MNAINLVSALEGEIISSGPTQIRVVENGSRTDNRLSTVEITLQPGVAGSPRHLHRMHDETFLITRGIVH